MKTDMENGSELFYAKLMKMEYSLILTNVEY